MYTVATISLFSDSEKTEKLPNRDKQVDRHIVALLKPYSCILSSSLHSVSRKLSVVRLHTIGPQPHHPPVRSHPILSLLPCPTDVTVASCRELGRAKLSWCVIDRTADPTPFVSVSPLYSVYVALRLSNYRPARMQGSESRDTSKRTEAGLSRTFSVYFWFAAAERGPRQNKTLLSFSFWRIFCCRQGLFFPIYTWPHMHTLHYQAKPICTLWNASVTVSNYSPFL